MDLWTCGLVWDLLIGATAFQAQVGQVQLPITIQSSPAEILDVLHYTCMYSLFHRALKDVAFSYSTPFNSSNIGLWQPVNV